VRCNNINYGYIKFKRYKTRFYKKKILITLFFLAFIIFLIAFYIAKVVNPILYSYSYSQINKIAVNCGSEAIASVISSNNYDDFVKVEYISDGYVSSIKADIDKINKVGSLLVQDNQKRLNRYFEENIKVPVGTISGISLLAGKGRNINISTNLIGDVKCDFYTEFKMAGINQTIHKIYVKLISHVSLILPFKSNIITNEQDYLISECLIIGKIPDIILGISDFKNLNSLQLTN